MRFTTLEDWLAWQETYHPKSIDLGLDRIKAVHGRMGLTRPAPVVITVGGTNGKGSCVAFLESMLRCAGYRVGTYTSPHLVRYNERVTLDGRQATDDEFIQAFDRVDKALDDVTLSYFEFGTLAAFDLMERSDLDVAVLEVGLGGRLDAVNIMDADCVLITTVALDHTDYLGPDRESIGREKAGIMRKGRPAVCGDREPPRSLLDEAERIGADLVLLGRDFDYENRGNTWAWSSIPKSHGGEKAIQSNPPSPPQGEKPAQPNIPSRLQGERASQPIFPSPPQGERASQPIFPSPLQGERARERGAPPQPHSQHHPEHPNLPKPTLPGPYQLANAACCLQVLACLSDRLDADEEAVRRGLRTATVPGRLQCMEVEGVAVILDVAHNPQAAASLASALEELPNRRPQVAVFAALNNKDHRGVVAALRNHFDHWYLAGLEGERGLSGHELANRLGDLADPDHVTVCRDVVHAFDVARHATGREGRVVVFGSFHTVEAIARQVMGSGDAGLSRNAMPTS